MKKTGKEGIQKGIISGTLAVVLVLTAVVIFPLGKMQKQEQV